MDAGSNKSLFTLITVIIFGIFLSLSYWFFGTEFKGVLASVIDGVKTGTVVNMEDTFALPNAESDFLFEPSTGTILGYVGKRKNIVIPDEIDGVILPTNLTILEERVFYNTFITSIELPSTLKEIKDRALYGTPMTKITLPEGLTIIGDSAFKYSKLQGIRIPSTVTNIGTYAFTNTDIVNVEVPNSTVYRSSVFPSTSVITKY